MKLRKRLYLLAVSLFVVVLLITSVELLSFRTSFYDKMYRKLEVANTIGISDVDLYRATEVLLDYTKGKTDTLDLEVEVDGRIVEMFNQREKDHMVDVQVLMKAVLMIRNIATVFVAAMLVISLGMGDYLDFLLNKEILGKVLFGALFILAALGIFILVDFDSFWTLFHKVLFRNDLWLLNPATDRLIMMVPLEFFTALVYRILASFVFIFMILGGVYALLTWKVNYDTRRLV